MMGMDREAVEGQPWSALAAAVNGRERQLRVAAGRRRGRGRAADRRAAALPGVARLADPRDGPAHAHAGARRDRRPRGRPDDPLALPVPPGPRRGPHAAAAPDERGDRGRAQPDRARPARRAGPGRERGVAVAGGGPADDQGGRHRPRDGGARPDPRGAHLRGGRPAPPDVGPASARARGAGARAGAARDGAPLRRRAGGAHRVRGPPRAATCPTTSRRSPTGSCRKRSPTRRSTPTPPCSP